MGGFCQTAFAVMQKGVKMTNGEAINWIINLSADIGKVEHRALWHYEQALDEIREVLELAQPERKTGKWILVTDNNGQHWVCDKCSEWRYHQDQKYCGECGADMRGEPDDRDDRT